MYHYEANANLAKPIAGFNNASIIAAYEKTFAYLKEKGFTPRINVADNQASKTVKNFLTKQQCKLMLVQPNNHRVNAVERSIQVFKNHFISALATTDIFNCGTNSLPKCKTR